MTRVIVTGGNGFTGYHVIKRLLKDTDRVVLSIDTADYRSDIHAYQEQMSLHDPDLKDVIRNFEPDYVIHLAATHYIPYCNLHPVETFHNNVMGTAALLRALPRTVKGVFAASSAAVYQPSRMPHNERSPTWPTDVYGFTKVAMEYTLRKWGDDHSVPVCLGRYFNMYGWGETTPHLIPVIVNQLVANDGRLTLGNIDTRRDYVHVEDNARSTVGLMFMRYNGPINLGSGVSYSAKDIVAMLGTIMRIDASIAVDQSRVRQVDRPNLVADMTEFNRTGLDAPRGIMEGLAQLAGTGVGPYMKETA
jgi:UDP-glucose 4-epimerase